MLPNERPSASNDRSAAIASINQLDKTNWLYQLIRHIIRSTLIERLYRFSEQPKVVGSESLEMNDDCNPCHPP
jgi:hypothetical protein